MLFARLLAKREGDVVHFSGFARKMNHFPSLFALASLVRKGIYFFVVYLENNTKSLSNGFF